MLSTVLIKVFKLERPKKTKRSSDFCCTYFSCGILERILQEFRIKAKWTVPHILARIVAWTQCDCSPCSTKLHAAQCPDIVNQ